uniref:Glycosyltransferase 61 catalytic domain-containing protein n=1 Tax=Paramoeba aestuarina TaxID=180227 RepID=A0A7S4KEU8_9EUKA
MNQEVYFDMLHSMAVIHMDHGLPERAVEIGDQLLKLDYQRFALLVGQIRARLVPYDKEAIGLLMNHLSTSVSSCKTTIDCDSELEFVFDWEKLPESSNLKVQQINKETALLPFGPEFSRGEGIEGRYSNFKVYHAEMKDAYLSGNALRQECKLIAGSQKQLLASSNVCVETFSDIAKISSNVPLFSLFPNFGSESYFHWILGGLTRVVMYQSMFSDTFSKGEYQLLLSRLEKGEMNGFVRETLELLLGDNVGEKVVEYPLRDATHISSTFHVIDWVTPQESIYLDNAWSISYPPKELLELTHSRFNEILGNENKEGRIKVLYVEREEKKGNGRYVQEQNEFKGQMREKCEELGVDFGVHTGKEPLKEQFNLFSKADLVIGPHGAGMANILFCQPGTSVRLFPMFPKVDDSFHYLSAALDLDYEEITTIQSTTKGNYGILNESKLNDVLESIETVVRQRNDKGADCQN